MREWLRNRTGDVDAKAFTPGDLLSIKGEANKLGRILSMADWYDSEVFSVLRGDVVCTETVWK